MSMTPPPPPPPPTPPGYVPYATGGFSGQPNFAGWGSRLAGALLNGIAGFPFYLPGMIALLAGPKTDGTCTVNGRARACEVPSGATIGLAVLLYLAGAVAYYVIYSRQVAKTGQFWGHKVAGVKIVDANTGGFISAGRAFGRAFAHVLDALPCYLGFLWPLWDAKKQTFADKIVGTYSVKA